jgi:class 3 adenylate cyclase
VSHLIIENGSARLLAAPDYPYGLNQDSFSAFIRAVVAPDAIEQGMDILTLVAPSAAGDPTIRAWFDRAGNLGATPGMAAAHWAEVFGNDVRPLLAQILAPTLVLHRREVTAPFLEVGHGRYLGKQIPGAKYVELPGADALYWVGDTAALLDEIEEFVTGVRGGSGTERVLATLLFTDIVGSTDRAAQLGDKGWRDLLDRHDQCVRTEIGRFRGDEVNTVGDGFVATFDSPSRAIECALAIREVLKASDIGVRVGIHTGEVEIRGHDVAGMAVHIGARVAAIASSGEVLVSSTVKDSVVGSNVDFEQRGEHELKGVPGTWQLFVVKD